MDASSYLESDIVWMSRSFLRRTLRLNGKLQVVSQVHASIWKFCSSAFGSDLLGRLRLPTCSVFRTLGNAWRSFFSIFFFPLLPSRNFRDLRADYAQIFELIRGDLNLFQTISILSDFKCFVLGTIVLIRTFS